MCDLLADSQASTSHVFIPTAFKNASQGKSPALSFLISLISDCLSTNSQKTRERARIAGLKVAREILHRKPDEEGFAFVLLVFTELVTHKEANNEIFQAIFFDMHEKFVLQPKLTQTNNSDAYQQALAKFLVFVFQNLPEAEYSPEVADILKNSLLSKVLLLRARLIQIVLKVCKFCTAHEGHLQVFKSLLQNLWLNDSYLKENKSNLIRFIVVCFRICSQKSRLGAEVLQVIKDVCGDEYYQALATLHDSPDVSEAEKKLLEHQLSESVLHRLVSIKGFSKMSLISGIRHMNSAVKLKSIELLLSSETSSLNNPVILKEYCEEIAQQFNPEILKELLNFPLREVALDRSQQIVLFNKFLAVDDHTVRNQLKLAASSHQDLKRALEVLDVFLGQSKSFKASVFDSDQFIEIAALIIRNLALSTTIAYGNLAKALLASKQYTLFDQVIKLIATRDKDCFTELFSIFQLNFNTTITSLTSKDLIAGFKTIGTFRELALHLTFEAKDGSTFLKMVLALLFSEEYSVELDVLEIVSNVLSGLREIELQDIPEIDKSMLILLLKGLRNDQLKNGHFLKILQTVRFAIKQTSGPGLQIYKQLLKKLIGHKFEFESGSFSQFDEADLKPVKDYLLDQKNSQEKFVEDFITYCLASTSYYADLIQFLRILTSIAYSKPALPGFLASLLTKIDANSNDRTNLVRQAFNLYLVSTDQRSQPFELALSKHRALLDTSFDYLASKKKYQGFLELVELFMEINFKNNQLITEVSISPSHLISLTKRIIDKSHEGLISAVCILLSNQCDKSQATEELAALLLCYKFLYRALLNGRPKKDQTEVALIDTLRTLYLFLSNHQAVKLLYEQDTTRQSKGRLIEFKLIPLSESKDKKKSAEQTQQPTFSQTVIEENSKDKLLVLVDEFYTREVYEYFNKKIEDCVRALVLIKYDRLNEEVNTESLEKFVYLKSTVEYLLQTNKNMKSHIETFVRTMLFTFTTSIDAIKSKLKEERNRLSSTNKLQLEKELEQNHHFMVSKLHQEIDFIMLKIMRIISDQFGQKKLKICSEVLLFWMLLGEKHKNNSLLRLLTNFYRKAEKKGLHDLNPLIDSEVYYISKFIKSVTKEIFGSENMDVVINLLISLYIFSSAEQVGPKKTELHFRHFCHFLTMHMMDKNEDLLTNCHQIISTLQSGISNLKGFLPTDSTKLKKKPKSKVIRDFLHRADPFDSNSTSKSEKVRGMRFCLIYHGFLNSCMKNKRLVKYIQTAIIQQNNDYKESHLMKKLQELMLETFKFDYEFDTIEAGYQQHVKNKKPQALALFIKIKSSCTTNIKAISELIPLELYPLAITDKLAEDSQDFEILLRLSDALIDRIGSSKVTTEFIDYFASTIKKFTSQGAFLLQSSDKKDAKQKFVQSIFVCIGQLQKKNVSKAEEIFNDNLEPLLEIATKQSNPIVKLACLGSISLFSRNFNDQFIAYLDPFFESFERYILDYFATSHPQLFDLFKTHKLIAQFAKQSKAAKKKTGLLEGLKPAALQEIIKSWLKSFDTVVKNMANMLQPYLSRMTLYLAFINQSLPEQRAGVLLTLDGLLLNIEARNLIEPLQQLHEAVSKKIFHIETTRLVNKSLGNSRLIQTTSSRTSAKKTSQTTKTSSSPSSKKVLAAHLDIKLISTNFQAFSEFSFDEEIDTAVKSIATFALKCSENTFKAHFESMIKWSKVTHDYTTDEDEMMERKLVAVKMINHLIRAIGRFGINYYGHLFEYFVGFLDHCQQLFKHHDHGKRAASFAPERLTALHAYPQITRLILQSLDLLFKNDKKGFVDPLRFEKLVKPLTVQLQLVNLSEDFYSYAVQSIIPPLVSLVELVSDDYMWKTLLYNVSSVHTDLRAVQNQHHRGAQSSHHLRDEARRLAGRAVRHHPQRLHPLPQRDAR